MMNKKGNASRIILWCLFFIIIGFLIYSLVLTYKEIKKKNPSNENVTTAMVDFAPRFINNNDVLNLYNSTAYPFTNSGAGVESDSNHGCTGFYIWCDIGTYSVTLDNSFISTYQFNIIGVNAASSVVTNNPMIYNSGWVTTSTFTFTLNNPVFIGFYVRKPNNSNFDATLLNNFNYMFNEGQPVSYVAYNNDFANALDYVSSVSFSGTYKAYRDNNVQYAQGAVPNWGIFNSDVSSDNSFNPSVIINNRNDLGLDKSIQYLYNNINTRTFNWNGSYFSAFTTTYNLALSDITIRYTTSSSIPISYFNFMVNGINKVSSTDILLILNCNDNINVTISFNSSIKFDYQQILNINPLVTSINSFSFYIYYNEQIDNIAPSYINSINNNNVILQNNNWSDFISFCSLHLTFDNYYGDNAWQAGFDEGFRQGQKAADEGLYNSNIYLQEKVNELQNDVYDLTSRVNSQSNIIEQLNNELNSSSNNFKGLFFTMADVPFKTVSNALGFEFWGVNLFRFFVGVITALGIVWLIKKII